MSAKNEKRFGLFLILLFVAIIFWQLINKTMLPAITAALHALLPFLFAFVTAYLLKHPVLWLEHLLFLLCKRKEHRWQHALASVINLTVFLGLFGLSFAIVVPNLVDNITDLAKRAPDYISAATTYINRQLTLLSQSYHMDFNSFLTSAISKGAESLTSFAQALPKQLTAIVISSVSFVINLIIYVIATYYLLSDFDRNKRLVKRVLRAFLREDSRYNEYVLFFHDSDEIVEKYIVIKLLTSLGLGIAAGLVFKMIGLPYTFLLGAIIAVTNLIPYIGPLVGAIPPILAGLLYNPLSAVWAALAIFLLQQVESNFVTPKIMGDALHVSPFAVIFWVTILGAMFGIPGTILGAPAAAILSGLFKKIVEGREKRNQEEKDHATE